VPSGCSRENAPKKLLLKPTADLAGIIRLVLVIINAVPLYRLSQRTLHQRGRDKFRTCENRGESDAAARPDVKMCKTMQYAGGF
jgi:hypothetical protein